MKAVVLSTVNF